MCLSLDPALNSAVGEPGDGSLTADLDQDPAVTPSASGGPGEGSITTDIDQDQDLPLAVTPSDVEEPGVGSPHYGLRQGPRPLPSRYTL